MNCKEEFERIKNLYENDEKIELTDVGTLIRMLDLMDKKAKQDKQELSSLYGYQAAESLKTNGFTGGFTQQFTLNIYSNVDIIVMNKTGDKIYKNVDVFEHLDYLKISIQVDEFVIFYKDKIEWYHIRKHKENIENCRKIKQDDLGFMTESEVK